MAKRKVPPPVNAQITRKRGEKGGVAHKIIDLKLAQPNLSQSQISRAVGCSRSNVNQVLTKFMGKYSKDDLEEFQASKAEVFDALQMRVLMSIDDKDIQKAPLLPRLTGAAILEDKARLVRGQATQVNVNVLLDAAAMLREAQNK